MKKKKRVNYCFMGDDKNKKKEKKRRRIIYLRIIALIHNRRGSVGVKNQAFSYLVRPEVTLCG